MLLSVLIPSHNEERYIVPVIESIQRVPYPPDIDYEIIIIDDGSKDKTLLNLEKYRDDTRIIIFPIPANCGKGAAVRIGLEKARGDIVIIQDADLEYNPDDYPKILQPFIQNGVQAVYGSRFLGRKWGPVGGMRWSNFMANKFLSNMASLLYGKKITDEATAYKAVRRDFIRSIPLRANGFDICPEMTGKILRRGVKIVEVPIQYKARTAEQGKKIKWYHGFSCAAMLLRCRFTKQIR